MVLLYFFQHVQSMTFEKSECRNSKSHLLKEDEAETYRPTSHNWAPVREPRVGIVEYRDPSR